MSVSPYTAAATAAAAQATAEVEQVGLDLTTYSFGISYNFNS
jgi:hypothetical protein